MRELEEDEFLDFLNEHGLADKGERLTNTIPHIIIYEIDFTIVAFIELHEDKRKYIRI